MKDCQIISYRNSLDLFPVTIRPAGCGGVNHVQPLHFIVRHGNWKCSITNLPLKKRKWITGLQRSDTVLNLFIINPEPSSPTWAVVMRSRSALCVFLPSSVFRIPRQYQRRNYFARLRLYKIRNMSTTARRGRNMFTQKLHLGGRRCGGR
jgi:hypothetical protein